MANRSRGERTLKGDQTYTVSFTTNAIAQAEQALGYGIGIVVGNYMQGAFSIRETTTLLWAGLLKHHAGDEGISLEDAGEILDEILHKTGDTGGVFKTLMEAVNDALPFKTEDAADPKTVKATLATGTRSRQKNTGTASSKLAPVQG